MSDMTPEGVEPTPTPAPEPAAEPAPTINGPWAADLEQRFDDPAVRQSVDQYMREVIQPRITQLEQRPELPEGAQKLWTDLNDPDQYAQAFLNLTGELFDEDVATEVLGLLSNRYGDGPAEEPVAEPTDEPQAVQLPPEVQEMVTDYQSKQYDAAVEKAVEGIPEKFQNLIHPLVVAHDGDVAAAGAQLKQQLTDAGVLGETAPTVDDVPEPPPVAGTAPPAVPTEQKYGSIEEAISDWWREQNSSAPPPVGGV